MVIIYSVKYVIDIIMFVGNTLTIIIMKRKEFRETFHKLLIALAVFDNVFIMAALFTLIIRYVFQVIFYMTSTFLYRTFSLLDYKQLRFLSPIFMVMIIIASFAMVTSMYLTLAIRCRFKKRL